MSDSTTDEMRRLLDERKAKYSFSQVTEGTLFTVSHNDAYYFILVRDTDSGIEMWSQYFTPTQAVAATLGPVVTGETSDGYHTFNELYHHRAVLFSVIVAQFSNRAWKSKRHHDGTMFDGMFIVGIDTPDGQATYHYDIDPYWQMFRCRELPRAPKWDGHTPAEAIERIGKLADTIHIDSSKYVDPATKVLRCANCGEEVSTDDEFCPSCGARMLVAYATEEELEWLWLWSKRQEGEHDGRL